jgi:hypothetical protein
MFEMCNCRTSHGLKFIGRLNYDFLGGFFYISAIFRSEHDIWKKYGARFGGFNLRLNRLQFCFLEQN